MKLYDFRFVVRHAEFTNGMVTVPFGRAVYSETCAQMTLRDAKMELQRLSAAESRSHAASLTMKYRDDRKPAGFGAGITIYREKEST